MTALDIPSFNISTWKFTRAICTVSASVPNLLDSPPAPSVEELRRQTFRSGGIWPFHVELTLNEQELLLLAVVAHHLPSLRVAQKPQRTTTFAVDDIHGMKMKSFPLQSVILLGHEHGRNEERLLPGVRRKQHVSPATSQRAKNREHNGFRVLLQRRSSKKLGLFICHVAKWSLPLEDKAMGAFQRLGQDGAVATQDK